MSTPEQLPEAEIKKLRDLITQYGGSEALLAIDEFDGINECKSRCPPRFRFEDRSKARDALFDFVTRALTAARAEATEKEREALLRPKEQNLSPCPFCGTAAELNRKSTYWAVYCGKRCKPDPYILVACDAENVSNDDYDNRRLTAMVAWQSYTLRARAQGAQIRQGEPQGSQEK